MSSNSSPSDSSAGRRAVCGDAAPASAAGAPVALELRAVTAVPPGSAARRVLAAAFATHELEDSDVYIVLRGTGGACGEGRDLATATLNLEQLAEEQDAEDDHRHRRAGQRPGETGQGRLVHGSTLAPPAGAVRARRPCSG